MCGFAALFHAGLTHDPVLLDRISRDLLHRGPDSGDILSEPGFALVFRRLAIIDPQAASDQPMSDPGGRYTIVFNGEIYNYRQLRQELSASGVQFLTHSDTEVILQGYMQWGEAVFNRLEGMFALVIVDRHARTALAARDPLGIKPLYMHAHAGGVAFASEMRPLTRLSGAVPDPRALTELLLFRFAAGRLSNLQNIEKLPGGCLIKISLTDGTRQEGRYCDPLATLRPEPMDFAEAVERSEGAILSSLRQHLESDVGYTLQLSGGIDSSLISALAARESGRRLHSFGVHLGDIPEDEGRWRKLVVERYDLDHHEVLLSGMDFADTLPDAVRAMEGPTPHFGCVMLMLLCRRISDFGKVVLTGEGADEMFGGYQRYEIWHRLRLMGCIARLVPGFVWPALRRYDGIRRYAGRDPAIYAACYHDIDAMTALFPALREDAGARIAAAVRFSDFRSRMLAVDQSTYLESLLMRQDKMAMATSVEARVPFAHYPLAAVVNRIPHELRIPGGTTKPILKSIAEKYLPAELVHRRKVGLNLPLQDWLRNPRGLGRYLELLTEPGCRLATYGDGQAIRRAVEAFRRDAGSQGPSLPILVSTELWLRSLEQAA